jgi:recombination associated protein RdgC
VALVTGELSKLIPAVIAALGGEIEPGAQLPTDTDVPAARPAKPKQEAVTAVGDDEDPPF